MPRPRPHFLEMLRRNPGKIAKHQWEVDLQIVALQPCWKCSNIPCKSGLQTQPSDKKLPCKNLAVSNFKPWQSCLVWCVTSIFRWPVSFLVACLSASCDNVNTPTHLGFQFAITVHCNLYLYSLSQADWGEQNHLFQSSHLRKSLSNNLFCLLGIMLTIISDLDQKGVN